MERVRKSIVVLTIMFVGFQAENLNATYVPWDTLTGDCWIEGASVPAKIYSSF